MDDSVIHAVKVTAVTDDVPVNVKSGMLGLLISLLEAVKCIDGCRLCTCDYGVSRSSVIKFRKKFLEGHELLEDDTRPGQAHRVITPEMIAKVNALVLDNRRITVDEIHRKRESKQWKHATSPLSKKSKAVHTSSGKVMMSLFFDHKDPLLVEFLKQGTTINAERYQTTLQNLRRAIRSRRLGMLSNGVILLQDNALSHKANALKTTLQQFRPLKLAIRGHRFTTGDEVCDWVQAWIKQQPTRFFKDGIDRLVLINVPTVLTTIF
ncbi:histone-lysine N-methyltransferase SETMAR [Trichonephila clavipes]|nr:histone-lysine N-methyltransferase SETMAR [Trichonephila clavipes]